MFPGSRGDGCGKADDPKMGEYVDLFDCCGCYGIGCSVAGGCLLEGDAVEESENVMVVVVEELGLTGLGISIVYILLITECFTACLDSIIGLYK